MRLAKKQDARNEKSMGAALSWGIHDRKMNVLLQAPDSHTPGAPFSSLEYPCLPSIPLFVRESSWWGHRIQKFRMLQSPLSASRTACTAARR